MQFLSLDPYQIHSDPFIEAKHFSRHVKDVRITDFLGSVAQVQLI